MFRPLGPFGHISRFSFIQFLAGQRIQVGFGAEHLLLCFIQRQFGHGAFLKQFCVTVKICFFQIVFAYIFLVVGIKGCVIPFRVGVIRFVIRFRPVDLDVNILQVLLGQYISGGNPVAQVFLYICDHARVLVHHNDFGGGVGLAEQGDGFVHGFLSQHFGMDFHF